MHKWKVFAAALALIPAAVSAQISGPEAAKLDSARRIARELDTVSVHARAWQKRTYSPSRTSSATKTDFPLRDIPQSITVLSRALITDQSAQSMSEIARFIPGITFGQGEGHRDAPTIRGNASSADFYLDGVRDDAQYYRDTYNLERVEALKGPNAMVFGRGGGGGVINRVTKSADWEKTRTLSVQGGSFDHKRTTLDIGKELGSHLAGRVNVMAENSGAFRNATALKRRAFNPAATILAAGNVVKVGYEYLTDDRTVDRGVPSFAGRPSSAPIETFFGDPSASKSWLYAHNATVLLERESPGVFTLRNRTLAGIYDKQYQNVYPGALSTNGSEVSLSGYRSRNDRNNLFNQTDLVIVTPTRIRHTVLIGAEMGRQNSYNFRETGFFGTSTTLRVPFSAPTVASNVAFRQGATDADNNVRTSTASVYAQDQVELGRYIQAIAGVRGEQLTINFTNNRNAQKLSRNDVMVSPRIGLNLKPVEHVSIYGSMSVSHLPSAGDQFSSLTATTQTLRPETFRNRELGFKWDILPTLGFSSAIYKLDRTNTSAPNPVDPSRVLQTGAQQSSGFEANIAGSVTPRWQVFAGFANQRAEITSRTTASRAGATVPMVPSRSGSLWNRFDLTPRFGVGLGFVAQSAVYAAIDNSVTLPGFARADGAVYFAVARNFRLQANVENLLDRRYYANAHNNNNITPGAPRTLRISVGAF